MRKSSGRPSLALRVRNDDQPASSKKSRHDEERASGSDGRLSCANFRPNLSRLSYMGRMSVGKGKTAGVGYNMYATSVPNKRNSSGFGLRGRSDVPKDPRPITDRGYITRMIKTLCEFLMENGYRHPISVKILHAPTSKDFYKIFEFLYGHIIPTYKIGKKPEEEIPKIYKILGYPFAISKSSMFAIGSPHAWPNLLAALTWLVDLIKSCQHSVKEAGGIEAIAFPHKDDDFDSIPEDRIIFEYVEKTYKAFMAGEDEYDTYDEELSRVLKSKYEGVEGGNDALIAENARLSQELEMLEKEPDRLTTLREQHNVVRTDVQRFSAYLEDLERFKSGQERKLAEVEEELTSLKLELESTQQKHRHMQAIYETQNLTPADVTRAKLNRQELQRQQGLLEKTIEDLDQECWQEEVNIAKIREMIEAKSHEYNKLGQSLKLIPAEAEHAHGIDFEMKTAMSHHLTQDFESVLMPALTQLKKQCSEILHATESQKLKEIRSLEQVTELVQETKEETSLLERKIKTTEEEFECKKEILKREYEHALEENDNIQKEIMECLKPSQISLQDVQKELRDKQKQYDQQKLELAQKKQQAATFLHTVVSEVIDHRAIIRDKLEEVVDSHKELLEKIKLEIDQSASKS